MWQFLTGLHCTGLRRQNLFSASRAVRVGRRTSFGWARYTKWKQLFFSGYYTWNYFNIFCSPEEKLDTKKLLCFLIGDFNKPKSDSDHALRLTDCHHYSKFKGNTISTSVCLLRFTRLAEATGNCGLRDLIFSSFIFFVGTGIAGAGEHYLLVVVDSQFLFQNSIQSHEFSCR